MNPIKGSAQGVVSFRNLGTPAIGSVVIGDHANLADTETIVIGSKTYEWDNNATITPGNVSVTIGANAAADITNLVAAINANKPSVPVTASVDPVSTACARIIADSNGSAGNIALTTTMADPDNVVSGATLLGGEDGGQQIMARGSYTVTALDVTATNIVIPTGLASPRYALYSCRTATGGVKANTGLLTVSGGKLVLDFAGGTDPAATDVIVWMAWE